MCYLSLQPLDVALPASWVLVEAVAAALPAVVAADGSPDLSADKYHTKGYHDTPKIIYLLDRPYGLHEQLVTN